MHHQVEPDYLEDLDNFKTWLKSYDKSGEKVDERFPKSRATIETMKGKYSNSKETLRKNVYKKMEELLMEVMKNRNSFKQLFSCWKRER